MLGASRTLLRASRSGLFSSTVRRRPLQLYQGHIAPNGIRLETSSSGTRPLTSTSSKIIPKNCPHESLYHAKPRTLTIRYHKSSVRFFADKTPTEAGSTQNQAINSAAGKASSNGTVDSKTSDGPDMLAGVKSDMNVVKETFALRDVPRQVLYIGLAGLTPYVVTSSTTLFLAYDMNNIQTVGRGFMFTEETASALLSILEPVQVGYGAVILSFLGAIHWGLEFAGFGGHTGYRRYILGMTAPVLAWPTVFMPFDYALLTQFLGFTGMYFADAQATTKGWTPRWYTTYRFVLTFIVGASIVVTLVGRGKIGDSVVGFIPRADKRVADLKSSQMMGYEREKNPREYQMALKAAEKEERERQKRIKDEKTNGKEGSDNGEEEEGGEKPKGDKKQKDKGNKPGEDEQERAQESDEKSTKNEDSKSSNDNDKTGGEKKSKKKNDSEKSKSSGDKDSDKASDEKTKESEENEDDRDEDSSSGEKEKGSSDEKDDQKQKNKSGSGKQKGK